MSAYRYVIIGTGRPHRTEDSTGFGMAHAHYPAFQQTGKVHLTAVSDLVESRSRFFLEKHQTDAAYYADYQTMLSKEKPDIVSICTWPHLHADMTVAAAEAGAKVIHCEKPMATTWADCKRMKAAADKTGALLSFGHQRRHIGVFQKTRDFIQQGAVGELVQIEAEVGDMFDWGTHWLDMMFYYNAETPAEWVMAQIDSRTEKSIFGAFMENQGICYFKWRNGVRGILVSGHEAHIGCVHRIIGKNGTIELLSERKLRISTHQNPAWVEIEIPQQKPESFLTADDVVRQLDEPGHRCLVSANYAIQSTEVIFAAYYSSLYRGRIDLPLQHPGNALIEMLQDGSIGPNRKKLEN